MFPQQYISGFVYTRGLRDWDMQRRAGTPPEVANPTRAGQSRMTSSSFLTICSPNLELTASFSVSPPEEKNKEKEKGGDNSTDTAQGTPCGSTGDKRVLALSFCSALPFPHQILCSLVIYGFPCPQGAEPPRTAARQGFLEELRPDGARLDSGCPFLSTA